MVSEMILLDTSILIDYFRKKDKTKSAFFQLSNGNQKFAVSSVTVYEIYTGAPADQVSSWNDFFKNMIVLPLDSPAALLAAGINDELKK
jgi:predicted nucleic acid-binding protein